MDLLHIYFLAFHIRVSDHLFVRPTSFSCFKLIGLSKYLAGCEGDGAMRFAFSAALGYVAQVSGSLSDIRHKARAEMTEFGV